MVNRLMENEAIGPASTKGPLVRSQRRRNGRLCAQIRFTDLLYAAILAEASRRQWSFAHMVRHLCEASIEGIE